MKTTNIWADRIAVILITTVIITGYFCILNSLNIISADYLWLMSPALILVILDGIAVIVGGVLLLSFYIYDTYIRKRRNK